MNAPCMRREFASPGQRWAAASHAAGRGTIIRLLKLEESPFATYASAPFRVLYTQEDEPWIAAAVGSEPLFTPDLPWTPDDISDVILWDPRRNVAELDGEAASQRCLVRPYVIEDRLAIYQDPAAFFRAWGERRHHLARLAQAQVRGQWLHPVVEPTDGGLPGALAIGGLRHSWAALSASTLLAAAGTDPAELRRAVIRSANLPKIEQAR